MKHKWEQTSGLNYRCTRCLEMGGVSADWCDSDGVLKDIARIANRNDCKGKPRKSRVAPKLIFTRRQLLVVTNNHGGYLSGSCALCGSCGWLNNIEHTAGCLLADPKVKKVQLKGIK